jgi:N-sulfoglucosamine sulfohydrolase
MTRTLLLGVAALGCAPHLAAAPPNVLVFVADDLGFEDSGPYGGKAKTPNLDRLAAAGLRFDKAILTCSSCSPSRASLMTGRYPHSTGAEQLHWPLPADQVTLGGRLKAAGYYTVAAGKWHLGEPAKKQFDRTDDKVGGMVPALRDRPKDKPFFLWAAFVDPHRPYGDAPKVHRPADAVVPPYLPDVAETRADLAEYYDEIARMDGDIGKVLAELDRQGAAADTAVFFVTDNGRPFPRCKTTVYDSGIRTPLLVRWPAKVKPGAACDRLVSSVDFAPTILELTGATADDKLQGKSFARLLADPSGPPVRGFAFAEHNWHDYTARERAARSDRYKLIRNEYPELPGTPPADAVKGPTFQAMRKLRDAGELTPAQAGVFVAPRPAEEFYDLEADPHELTNLIAGPAVAAEVARHRAALDAWTAETADGPPRERTPDGFDRETGDPKPGRGRRVPSPERSSGPRRPTP